MVDYTMSSGNVFQDLGLSHPDERFAKAKLAYKINRLIAEKGMTQKGAASFLGISRAKMTALRNGRLNTFTIDQLFSFLGKLDDASATPNQPIPAWEAVCRIANKDSAQQARDLLSAIQEMLKWFPDFSDMIPQLRHSIAADGSILFEWIFSDYRIGFNIEPNPQESSWYLITNRKLGEISASGFISHINLRVLIQFLFSFILLHDSRSS